MSMQVYRGVKTTSRFPFRMLCLERSGGGHSRWEACCIFDARRRRGINHLPRSYLKQPGVAFTKSPSESSIDVAV